MTNKFKSISQNKKVQNFSFLTIAQGANYILPLLVFPYLIRVIGFDKFGIIMFVLAIIQFIKIITDYGFTLIAARDIAQNKNNINKLNEIIINVIITKLVLLIISSLILLILLHFNLLKYELILYLFGMLIILGEIFFPSWFFQGIEDMKYIAILQFISKLIFMTLILLLIKSSKDFIYVLLYQGIGSITISIYSIYLLKIKYSIKFIKPQFKAIIFYLKEGWHLFASSFFVKIYNTSNIIILGYIVSETLIGYYALAEKIILAVSSLITNPLNQSIYPSLSKSFNDIYNLKKLIKKYAFFLLLISTITAFLILIFSEQLVNIISGNREINTIHLLMIMSFSIIFFPFGAFFTQLLIIMKKNKYVMNITIYTAFAHYLILFPLILLLDIIGAAITIVSVRVIHLILHIIYYKKVFKNA